MSDDVETFAGDRAGAEQLRRALRVLADTYPDHPLGHRAAAVLDGRAAMRDLAADPEIAAVAHDAMQGYVDDRAAMTDDERRAADLEVARVADLAEAAEHDGAR